MSAAGGSARSQFLPRLLRSKAALVAAAVLALVVLAAVAAPWLAPNDPFAIRLIQRLKPPGYVNSAGLTFWLGTDTLGRDVLSRLIYGARVSLVVGLSAVAISGAIGLLLGLVSGYFGGLVDDIVMRIADIQLSFPTILLALAIMAVLGSGLDKLILVLGLTGWVQYGRIVRGQVLAIKHDEFVLAARATGERQWRILFQHILPNVWSPVIVVASFTVASNIVAEASLSFLGVGVPPSIPSWGTMLADGRQYIGLAEWLTLPAGMAISLTVLSINILGDWLRDFLDPRLKNIL
jgi:peptide/nickel transport system permease protein